LSYARKLARLEVASRSHRLGNGILST